MKPSDRIREIEKKRNELRDKWDEPLVESSAILLDLTLSIVEYLDEEKENATLSSRK